MNYNEFLISLRQFGDNLRNIDNELLEIGGLLVQALKSNAPYDTGELKNSIQAVVEDNTLKIEMLAYGVFQNYGVDGTKQRRGDRVPFNISPKPRNGNTYAFGINEDVTMISGRGNNFSYGVRTSIYQKGLAPKHWFDLDTLSEQIIIEIENRREL